MLWQLPIAIGSLSARNRIVFPPISGNWADPQGAVTEKVSTFYKRIAEGGCGMIVVGGTAVTSQGKGSDHSLVLEDARHLAGFSRLAETIRTNDCLASIQLMHVGGQGNPAFTGSHPVSPSGVPCRATGFGSQKLTLGEIHDLRKKFVSSAALAREAGFQAVELHMAHGYLLHEFLSEYTNLRDDAYGGTVENRLRFCLEILEDIRNAAPGLLLGARVSATDYLEHGLDESMNRIILPLLEEAGLDYFSVTAGIYETSAIKHNAMKMGHFFEYSKAIKSIVGKPVIGVGKILCIEQAEEHLKNADCDLVAIGRGMLADPAMVNKTRSHEPITVCTECNQCQYLRHGLKDLSCPLEGG